MIPLNYTALEICQTQIATPNSGYYLLDPNMLAIVIILAGVMVLFFVIGGYEAGWRIGRRKGIAQCIRFGVENMKKFITKRQDWEQNEYDN